MAHVKSNGTHVLILTGRFGMGHISAAHGVRDSILEQQPDAHVTIIDFFSQVSPDLSKTMYRMFNFWTRYCPGLYNKLNAVSCHMNKVPLDKGMIKKINNLIATYDADAVVSTLPFCSQCISTYKKTTGNTIPLYTYITDIVAHEEWIASHTTGYYVGAQMTKDCLLKHGVSADKITVSGIPVRSEFLKAQKMSAGEKPEVVIMGGGLGLIPLSDEFLEVLNADATIHVTFIAGKNKKLKRRVHEKFPNISVIGFTKKASSYIAQADVLVTKSGGITTFEAIYTNTPLYVLKPFLAQEVGNTKFIEQEKIGVVASDSGQSLARDIVSMAHDTERLSAMSIRMGELRESWSHSLVGWLGDLEPAEPRKSA